MAMGAPRAGRLPVHAGGAASAARLRPSLLDRLMTAEAPPSGLRGSLDLAQLKASIARDVEHLLNSRACRRGAAIHRSPLAASSVVNLGLADALPAREGGMTDRMLLLQRIHDAIVRHEPRLRDVRLEWTTPVDAACGERRLVIDARMVVEPVREPVTFSARLAPAGRPYRVEAVEGGGP